MRVLKTKVSFVHLAIGQLTERYRGELICFLIALLSFAQMGIWRMQILYMFLLCVTEILRRYLVKGLSYVGNAWLYNVFLVIEAFFVIFMFYQLWLEKPGMLNAI